MRKYYLFVIKKDIKDIYRKNSKSLYAILYNLYKLKGDDIRMGSSIYYQLCHVFSKDILINYMKEKYHLKKKDKYFLNNKYEEIFIKFGYSCVIIYSTSNIPRIFKILYLYNKNIFVADFKNDDYFWLTKETIY